MDAFDADVLIYASVPGHALGRRVAALFPSGARSPAAPPLGAGSVLLISEVLAKPVRDGRDTEIDALAWFLARLDLWPVDAATAEVAVALSASYRLQAIDALHLAAAVQVGADRFVTNNRAGFPRTITEVEVVYPADLPDPGDP